MTKYIRDKSILVVDDDTRMLHALDKVLTAAGAAVIRAEWAGDAIDTLIEKQKRIDLVITDLRMPFVSGMTVVFAIHKLRPGLPVIVLTAFGSTDVKDECMRQGAAAFLEKPLNTKHLLEEVEKVLGEQKARANPNAESEKPKEAQNSKSEVIF